jgi:hypothetical protein
VKQRRSELNDGECDAINGETEEHERGRRGGRGRRRGRRRGEQVENRSSNCTREGLTEQNNTYGCVGSRGCSPSIHLQSLSLSLSVRE